MIKALKTVRVLAIVIIGSALIGAVAFYVVAGTYITGNKDKWYENLYSEDFNAEIQRIEFQDNESLNLHLRSEAGTFFIEICPEQINANIRDLKVGDSIFKSVNTYQIAIRGSKTFESELLICD